MVKRIAKGYSAEQLSYLLGRRKDYISRVEFFDTCCYTISELNKIARALQEDDYNCFMPAVIVDERMKINMQFAYKNDNYVYTCSTLSKKRKKKIRFMLAEVADKKIDGGFVAGITEYDFSIVDDAVRILVRDDYFRKQRLPVDIFLYINRILRFTIDPLTLQVVLDSLCVLDCGCEDCLGSKLEKIIKGNYFYYLKDEE